MGCRAVDIESPEDVATAKGLASEMLATLYSDPSGVALAAPQVGFAVRVIVVSFRDRETGRDQLLVLANPRVASRSPVDSTAVEYCLSVPNVRVKVPRAAEIQLGAYDLLQNGNVNIDAKDFLARVLQHEVDHLDGILCIDKATEPGAVAAEFGRRRAEPTRRRLGVGSSSAIRDGRA